MNDTGIITNGDSLGDCRTNVFPLADARGLHWKKFVTVYPKCSKISEDPILCAYSNALHQGILCSWQTSVLPNPIKVEDDSKLSDKAKELILFWYGEEPQLSGVVNTFLKETETGCFEDGIPTEYQSLLFKSLHNLLERQLLGEKFFCNKGWFTKNFKKGTDWETLAFSFSFFIYGESLISASVNIQKSPVLRCLSRSDLSDAMSNDGIQVVLAPAGLIATLTGNNLMSSNTKAARILEEWEKFYPVVCEEKANDFIPCLVEIVHDDSKMLFPSSLVGVPVSKPGKKLQEQTQKSQSNLKDEKPTKQVYSCSDSCQKFSCNAGNLVSKVWSRIEHNTEGKKLAAQVNSTKTDTGQIFGPNKLLWDFKDRTRSSGCGCTSSTNVNRAKPVGRFASNISNIRGSQTKVASPNPNLHSSNQPPNVNQRVRKERKKSTLPFHQRRAATTERSPTPPIGLPANFKTSNRSNIQPASLEKEADRHIQDNSTNMKQIPHVQNAHKEAPVHVQRNLDHVSKFLQTSVMKSTKSTYDKSKSIPKDTTSNRYTRVNENRRKPDYSLPVNPMPKRPNLPPDLLEPRTLPTGISCNSIYSLPGNSEHDVIITGIVSPVTLASPLTKTGEHTFDSEAKIVRVPNKGVKRPIDQHNDGSKRARTPSGSHQFSGPFHVESGAPSQAGSLNNLQSTQHSQQLIHSQTFPNLSNQQQPMKRGPGRPKKQSSTSATSVLSPNMEQHNIYESDAIVSPPSVDKRRKSSTQNSRSKDGLASPPSITTIKAGAVKSRRRPSKKEQNSFEPDTVSLMSPLSARSNPATLSPLPHLPSPARTPGSISSVTFTHSKDLTVNISDLDKLFEGSDEEEDALTAKVNALPDTYSNQRMQNNDDVFRTSMLPPVTSTGLPHDLAEMFPTPPSQEPQIHAASPAMSTHSDYINPASVTMCHAVMSPEKHVAVHEKKYEEEVKSEIAEGLESPFTVPEWQMYPAGDMFLPISVLPSMKCKPLKSKNPKSLQYIPSWESTSKTLLGGKEKALGVLKLPNFDVAKPEKQAPLPASINPGLKSMPSGGKGLKHGMDVDISYQPAIDNVMNDIKIDKDANESLEIILRYRDYDNMKQGHSVSSPYQTLFRDDKTLSYDSHPCRTSKRRASLSKIKPDTVSNKTELPSRILELFKEQWQSPFSTLYLTKVVSKFYGINISNQTQAMDVTPNSALQLLCELNPSIQEALKKPLRRRSWDVNKIAGPASFQDLHKFAGKTTKHSNLPVHPILTGADGDLVSVSPNALQCWKKLFLEPFGGPRDVAYVVVAPDSDLVLENTKQFFKELSGIYESMNLGKHCPITRVLREGIIRVGQKVMQILSQEPVDEWFSQDDTPETARMKLIAQVCKCHLGPHLASLQLNRSLFEKSAMEERSSSSNENIKPKAPGTSANAMTGLNAVSSLGIAQDDADGNSLNGELPAIVVYMIDPFQISGVSDTKQTLWSFNGLLRAFSEMTASFSESLRNNVFLQIVPLESILQMKASTRFHNGTGLGLQDTHQLAFSVYSSCRMTINSLNSGKICTSFGQGALRDKLAKKRQEDNQFPSRIYLPPCVLAPQSTLIREDPHSAGDLARVMNISDYNILFCSYCLSSDQSWLLVTCTDKRGLLSDATVIKIHSHTRSSKPSRSARRLALKRLLNFITDTVSFYLEPWRIVISRLGRPGLGEFKDLYELIHKITAIRPSKKRPSSPDSTCAGCCSVSDNMQKSQIRSISLIAVQPEPLIKFIPVGNKRKTNLSSRIFVVQAVNHHSSKQKDRRQMHALPLPISQHDDLLSDPVFLLSQSEDDEHFMPLLPSPTEVANANMLTSPHSDLTQPVFSPGDGIISSSLSSPHINQMNSISPFQPIMHNSPAFSVMSPSPLMSRPSSTPSLRMTTQDEFAKVSRQPLSVGYIISGYDLASSCQNGQCPSVIKSEFLLHVSRNDGQISQHPLESENSLESHRFILERLESLSWLTVDPTTGKKHSSLASHIYLLMNFSETFNYFVK